MSRSPSFSTAGGETWRKHTYTLEESSWAVVSYIVREQAEDWKKEGGLRGWMEKWDSVLQCENRCQGFRVVSSELAWKDVLIYGSDVKSRGLALECWRCRVGGGGVGGGGGGGGSSHHDSKVEHWQKPKLCRRSLGKWTLPNVPLSG